MAAMTAEAAERVALSVVDWMAARRAALDGFLAASGASPDALSARLAEPETLAALLDHLLADEAMLLDCARDLGLAPQRLLGARAALPGGDAPHWT